MSCDPASFYPIALNPRVQLMSHLQAKVDVDLLRKALASRQPAKRRQQPTQQPQSAAAIAAEIARQFSGVGAGHVAAGTAAAGGASGSGAAAEAPSGAGAGPSGAAVGPAQSLPQQQQPQQPALGHAGSAALDPAGTATHCVRCCSAALRGCSHNPPSSVRP